MAEQQQRRRRGRPVPLPAPEQQQGPLAPLPAPEQQQGPLAPLPAPVPREITQNDYLLASQTVKKRGFPIPSNAPDVENTFWEFEKADHTTGDRQVDLVKIQCFNRSNLVGNQRRDILPLLNKKNRLSYKLLNKYNNELQGLEAHLQAKIDDFHQFVPNGFIMPEHFLKYPALK